MRMIVIVTVVLLIGCSKPPGSEGVSTQTQVNDPSYVPIAIESQGTSFGLLNAYSGTLSDEQNDTVHTALHGAYIVEATSKITAKALKKELESKELVAEEQHDGHRFVALKDFRHVQFSEEVSGQMIVIERYLVTPESE